MKIYMAAFFIFFCVVGVFAEETQETKPTLPSLLPPEGKLESPSTELKNVKFLKHLSKPELERVMGYITESLNVKCNFCHNQEDYSLDENPNKLKAREMVKMVQDLNKNVFQDERVACFTCHAGKEKPAFLPEDFQTLPSLVGEGKPRQLSEDFKNVRKLGHLSDDEYDVVMDFFVEAVGAKKCTFCHNRNDYSSDEIPKKVTARKMVGMVQDLNQKVFKKDAVTCYTCHQGFNEPLRLPENWGEK